MSLINKFGRMKRIISIFMAVAVVSIGMNVISEAASDIEVKINEPAVGLLTTLGVLNDEKSDGETLTRLEFARYLAKTMGIYQNQSAVDYYSDMGAYISDKGYIATLTERKIISGSGGTFRPDDAITYNEAVTMIVRMLGYEQYASAAGGYPKGYLEVLNKLDIGTNSADVTLDTAIELIYGALNSYVYRIEGSNANGLVFSSDSEITYLEEQYKIKMIKGSITEAAFVSLVGEGNLANNSIKIGETIILTEDFEFIDYVGSNVIAFYKYDDDVNELVYLYENKELNDEIIIDAKDFEELNGNYITYTDIGGKTRRVKVADKYYVIRNGECVTEKISQRLDFMNGTIKLIKSGKTNEYNVIKLDEYSNITVESIDYENKLIFSRYDSKIINYDTPEYMKFFYMSEEAQANHSILDVNDVLCVYSSDNGKYLKILLSDNKITDSISSVLNEDGRVIVTLGENEYKVTPELAAKVDLAAGGRYILRLNTFNEIAAVDTDWNNVESSAYMYKAVLGESGDEVMLRLFTETNEHVMVKCKSKVVIDGSWFSGASIQERFADERTGNTVDQLIIYKTNSNGEIVSIKTADGGELTLKGSGSTNRYSNGLFYPNYAVHMGTRYFSIPNDLTNRQDFTCTIGTQSGTGTRYFYQYDDSKPFVDYVVSRFDTVQRENAESNYYATMVSKITQMVNEDNEIINVLHGLRNNATVQLTVADYVDVSLLQPGDLIRYTTDWQGRISSLVPNNGGGNDIAFPYNNGVFPNWTGNQSSNYDSGIFRLTYGYVSDKFTAPYIADNGDVKYNSYIIIGYENPEGTDEFVPFDRTRKIAMFDVERRGDKAYYATFDEIKTYKDFGMDCDRVVISYNWALVKDAFIYRAAQ